MKLSHVLASSILFAIFLNLCALSAMYCYNVVARNHSWETLSYVDSLGLCAVVLICACVWKTLDWFDREGKEC